jgi:hypothetical protein
MKAVGLIHIPGVTAGMILAGTPPIEAVRYPIVIIDDDDVGGDAIVIDRDAPVLPPGLFPRSSAAIGVIPPFSPNAP